MWHPHRHVSSRHAMRSFFLHCPKLPVLQWPRAKGSWLSLIRDGSCLCTSELTCPWDKSWFTLWTLHESPSSWLSSPISTGWWFGTWFVYDFPYIGKNNSNWRTHVFQRGGSTTNQSIVQVRETVLISRGDALVVTPLCATCTLESKSRAISIYFQQFELPLGTILSFNILYYDWFQEMYGYLIFKKKYEIRSGWWFQTCFPIYWEH